MRSLMVSNKGRYLSDHIPDTIEQSKGKLEQVADGVIDETMLAMLQHIEECLSCNGGYPLYMNNEVCDTMTVIGDIQFIVKTLPVITFTNSNCLFVAIKLPGKICILNGFPCEMDYSDPEFSNPTRVACDEHGIRRQVVRIPSHKEDHAFSRIHFKAPQSC